MNPTGQIFRNTAILAASQGIQRVGSILLAFFVARILHAPGLGVYAGAMAIYELVAIIGEMGVSNLLVREVGKDHSNTNRYLFHLGALSAGVSGILMLIFLLALPHLGYSPELTTAMYTVILAIIPATLNNIQEGVFVAHQRVEFVTLTTTIATLLNIGVSLYLLLTGYGIVSLLVAFVISQCAITVCYLFLIHRFISPLHWEFDFHFALDLAHEIKTFAAVAILAAFFARPEVIILTLVSTATQVGYYSAALRVFNITQLVPQMYMTNVFPVLSRAYHVSDNSPATMLDQSTKYVAAFTLPMAVGVALAAGPIIRLLYGPGFESAVPVLQILALNIPLAAFFAILWRVLFARHRQDQVLKAMTVSTGLELVAGFLLISRWGALGAAIVASAISLIYSLLLMFFLRRDGSQTRPIQLAWRFGAAAGGMGVVMWAIGHAIGPSGPFSLVLLVPAALVSFALLVYLFKAFSPEDLAFVQEFLDARAPQAVRKWLPLRDQRARLAEENTVPGK
jgi:O-antigen/teichoic acid export membrane protein